jgi:hypothetical protein
MKPKTKTKLHPQRNLGNGYSCECCGGTGSGGSECCGEDITNGTCTRCDTAAVECTCENCRGKGWVTYRRQKAFFPIE